MISFDSFSDIAVFKTESGCRAMAFLYVGEKKSFDSWVSLCITKLGESGFDAKKTKANYESKYPKQEYSKTDVELDQEIGNEQGVVKAKKTKKQS